MPTSVRPEPHGKFPVLVSYALVRGDARSREEFRRLVEHPDIELLLDSGAFTALNVGEPIELRDYLAFLERWGDKLFGYLALDVLGDPVGTDRNLALMLKAGFKPVPVHVRGDGQERMDELFGYSDWVACGGLRRPHKGWSSREYVKQKMIWARGRNVHWLGYTHQGMVRGFKPYSVDCSNWSVGARWGQLHIYLGDLEWVNRGRLDDGALDRPLSRREVEAFAELGFTPVDVRNPKRWRSDEANGQLLREHVPFRIGAWGWVKYIRDIRRLIGTRLFLAYSPIPGHLDTLLEFIDRSRTTTP